MPVPPSSGLALAGATVLVNLSGSPITIGRANTRSLLCRSQSLRCLAAYLYAAAGQGESTTDLSWDGQTSVFENGKLLGEGARFAADPQLTISDIDLDLLTQERAGLGTFDDNRRVMADVALQRQWRCAETLIQYLTRWVAGIDDFSSQVDEVLLSISSAENSPELIPVKEGEAPQSTEKSIGPYELQDFNLFYTLRYGFRPSKIAFLALHAWCDVDTGAWPVGFPTERQRAYDLPPIRHWLTVFVTRSFGFRPVQTLGDAQRPEGLGRWITQPARRLARTVGRQRRSVAGEHRTGNSLTTDSHDQRRRRSP